MEAKLPKVYVEVNADFMPNGDMIPRTVRWEDGTLYRIDRVIEYATDCEMRSGGRADRYTVKIGTRETYLFFERSKPFSRYTIGKWVMERRYRS